MHSQCYTLRKNINHLFKKALYATDVMDNISNNFYLLQDRFSENWDYIRSCDYELSQIDPSVLWSGKKSSKAVVSKIQFQIEKRKIKPIWLSNIVSWPIVRNPLLHALRVEGQSNDWIQVFALESDMEYSIINLLSMIPALDLKLSNYEKFDTGSISHIYDYVLQRSNLQYAPPIFRLAEDPCSIIVNDTFHSAMQPFNDWGCELLPVKIFEG